ncbi:hypothetical protein TSTA_109500 [Talaromyces stipitatus ATCC 10500]|uniref:Uncharacterized protein n=1 Tax=Talaromyces stipitatus (strain ATCC 10500 / CBS 375.48 / QM 6759 / NRRL 1006) TaxID=441959 RepID=B8MU53_TALSN|nr:uncharacterized protein TSTA_109500 [Talaromyces stipitatus ATCC 10500]EED11771.1 hypothetical protein TSTA_109500 [Talaromyces stipitatus ATCC 10500]
MQGPKIADPRIGNLVLYCKNELKKNRELTRHLKHEQEKNQELALQLKHEQEKNQELALQLKHEQEKNQELALQLKHEQEKNKENFEKIRIIEKEVADVEKSVRELVALCIPEDGPNIKVAIDTFKGQSILHTKTASKKSSIGACAEPRMV